MEIITNTALGGLINITPDFVTLLPNKEQKAYLEQIYTGEADVWASDLLDYKHGTGKQVSDWMRDRGFSPTFNEKSPFAMAAFLEVVTKWLHKPEESLFKLDGEIYQRAIHTKAMEIVGDPSLVELELSGGKPTLINMSGEVLEYFKKHETLRLFVSTELKELSTFNTAITQGREMELHLPYAESSMENEIEELCGMNAILFGEEAEVDNVHVTTKFRIDNLGAKAEQMASMAMCYSGCLMPQTRVWEHRIDVIDRDYYCYITLNDKLAFAVKIETDDFISGTGLCIEPKAREGSYIQNPAFNR
ncbi:conserved hypothetical protein [Vibrio chagasii]|nr:conserved hypothetical protein [Vibrio chagasii]